MFRSYNRISKIVKIWIFLLTAENCLIPLYSIKIGKSENSLSLGYAEHSDDITQSIERSETLNPFDVEKTAPHGTVTTIKDLSDGVQEDEVSDISTHSSPSSILEVSTVTGETTPSSPPLLDASPKNVVERSSSKSDSLGSQGTHVQNASHRQIFSVGKTESSKSRSRSPGKSPPKMKIIEASRSPERSHSTSMSKTGKSKKRHHRSKPSSEKSITERSKSKTMDSSDTSVDLELSPSILGSTQTIPFGISSPEGSLITSDKSTFSELIPRYVEPGSKYPNAFYSKTPLIPEEGSPNKTQELSNIESSSLFLDESSVKSQMPSRKSLPKSEISIKPYSPVHDENENSDLLDGSLISEETADISSLPAEASLQTNIGSNSMVLLSHLYGISALSGVQPDSNEIKLEIEMVITETLFNTGIHISNADIVIFTNRIIFDMVDPDMKAFSALINHNSFESIPNYQRHSFNYIECVYQLENILFHTRSLIRDVTMTHILVACNNIRNSLKINNSIIEKREILNDAIKYLILKIYNISNEEIINIINGRYPLPGIIDPNNIEKLSISLFEDFKSNKFSFPLVIDFWKTLLIQQLYMFNYNSKELIDKFLNDKFGLVHILLETMFISPIKMCPYVISVMFYNINRFPIDEININSIKIHTFCLIYLKNMGFYEKIVLEMIRKPEINIDKKLNSITKDLSPGFNILPYFHPEFPKTGEELRWESCYSIFSSVSMVLNSINRKLLFPQLIPLCNKLTKKEPVISYILDLFERTLGIPKSATSSLVGTRDINELISSLSSSLEVSKEFIDDFYNKYIYGNPMKYLNTFHSVFSKTMEYALEIEKNNSNNGSKYVTNNNIKNYSLFEKITHWNSIHLYFISFTFSVPNPAEIVGGIYSFTLENCESLLFQFFRRISFSNRSSIVDSFTICMTIYLVINKENISPVLVKNSNLETIKSVINYKIGTWAPTKNEWMRSIYMSLESRLDIVPSISTVQTLGITINLDFFNCFYSINKYLHGLVLVSNKKNTLRLEQREEIMKNRLLGFDICSTMSIGAHSTKEETIELKLISSVLESIRQFGFNSNIENIREFIQEQKQINGNGFPSGITILDHVTLKFPKKLRDLMFKAFGENQNSNSLPYFVIAERAISSNLQKYNCVIDVGETTFPEKSSEISDGDLSISERKTINGIYNNILNSCLSWRTYGYYNIISCYSGILTSNLCNSKDKTLDVVIEIAKSLEWPTELIIITLSQDFSFSDLNSFLELKSRVDQNEIQKYYNISSDLIVYVNEQKNDFSWSEKSLTNPETTISAKNPSIDEAKEVFDKVNYLFAFGFLKSEINNMLKLWDYRRDVVINQIKYFPVDMSLKVSDKFIRDNMLIEPLNNVEMTNSNILPTLINMLKELCYERPYGALLCQINYENGGIPNVKIPNYDLNEIFCSISVFSPPIEVVNEEGININISVAVPTEHSANGWRLLEPKTILYLSVILSDNFEMERSNYIYFSRMYFPYSGEYIRLTPPAFILEVVKNSNSSEFTDYSGSDYSLSSSTGGSTILPGIWHENLGNITINKLYKFVKYVPDNSKLILSIVWTLISSFNSFWAGNVEHCNINMNSIFIYTGTNSQLKFDLETSLNEFIEDKQNDESIRTVTSFILQTLSPPLIRFGNLGRSKIKVSNSNYVKTSDYSDTECNDRHDILVIIKAFLEVSEGLMETLGNLGIESLCHEITNLDSTKLNCNYLAWVNQNKNYPKDLEKLPITDVFVITPSIDPNIIDEHKYNSFENGINSQETSDVSEKSYNSIHSENSLSINSIQAPVSVSTNEQVQERDGSLEYENVAVPDNDLKQKEESTLTSSYNTNIFDPVSVKDENSFPEIFEHKQETSEFHGKLPYDKRDLNEFVLARIPKGALLNLPFFPKVPVRLSERRIFEIKELASLLKSVVENISNTFTAWSAFRSKRHPEKIPNIEYRPMFILVPPTPNNRADSLQILERYYNIDESVFLYTREKLNEMVFTEEQKDRNELVEVLICKASNYYVNLSMNRLGSTEEHSEISSQGNSLIQSKQESYESQGERSTNDSEETSTSNSSSSSSIISSSSSNTD